MAYLILCFLPSFYRFFLHFNVDFFFSHFSFFSSILFLTSLLSSPLFFLCSFLFSSILFQSFLFFSFFFFSLFFSLYFSSFSLGWVQLFPITPPMWGKTGREVPSRFLPAWGRVGNRCTHIYLPSFLAFSFLLSLSNFSFYFFHPSQFLSF